MAARSKANGSTVEAPPVRLAWAEDVPEASEGWVTQRQLAAHLDLTPRRIRALLAEGILPAGDPRREKGGTLDLARCRVGYLRYLRDAATGRVARDGGATGGDEHLDLTRERAALAKAQREAQELKNEEQRGELVRVGDVLRVWGQILLATRNRLRAVPGELRRALPALTPTDVEAVASAIDTALTELADSAPLATSPNAEDEASA